MSSATWIMNFLLVLAAYGTELTPGSDVAPFDINGNGVIDIEDLLDILVNHPQVEGFGLYKED
jgi:hypothetical protein